MNGARPPVPTSLLLNPRALAADVQTTIILQSAEVTRLKLLLACPPPIGTWARLAHRVDAFFARRRLAWLIEERKAAREHLSAVREQLR